MSIKKIKKISKNEIAPDIFFDNNEEFIRNRFDGRQFIFSITSTSELTKETLTIFISIEPEYIAQKLYLSIEVINRYFGRFFSKQNKQNADAKDKKNKQEFRIKLIDAVGFFIQPSCIRQR